MSTNDAHIVSNGHGLDLFNKLKGDLVVCASVGVGGVSDLVLTVHTFSKLCIPNFIALVVLVGTDEYNLAVCVLNLCNLLISCSVGVVIVEVNAIAVFSAFEKADTYLAIPVTAEADLEHIACVHSEGDGINVSACNVFLGHGEVSFSIYVVPVCLAHIA